MTGPYRHAWVVLACLGAASPWTAAHAAPPALNGCFIHEAVAGDTLIGLAEQHLARVSDWRVLARVNQVRSPRRIPIGTRLCLPLALLKPTPQPGVVLDVAGTVTREPPAAGLPLSNRLTSAPVSQGDVLPVGTLLRTGAHGFVTVQLPDGSTLKIQPDTEARLTQSQRYETTGSFSSMWEVLRGRVESWVKPVKDGQPRHQIKTPQATLGVRGTDFRVVTDGDRMRAETLSGSVAVRGAQKETVLHAGHGALTQTGQPPTAALPLPAAPDIGMLPTLHERVVLKFVLPEMPGAHAWRIQVAEDEQFHRIRGEAVSSTPVLRLTDLPDGHYFLRARVANAQGLEGANAVKAFRLKARPEPPIPIEPAHQAKLRQATAPLRWAAHPKATHYRLQVARDEAFQDIVVDEASVKDTQTTLALAAGDYLWRVATTAPGMDHGPWGDAQLLRMREPPAQPAPPIVSETTLHFQLPAEHGQRFEFQMASDEAFGNLLAALGSDDGAVTVPRPAEGGLLWVRYRAIDEDGFVGPYTTPQKVALPACVRSGSGACVEVGAGRYLTTGP